MAFAAQTSYQRSAEFRLSPGDTATFGGHRFTLVDQVVEDTPAALVLKARIRIDDGPIYAPARQQYKGRGDIIATPSVRTGLTEDVYLTLLKPATADDARVTFGVRLMPLTPVAVGRRWPAGRRDRRWPRSLAVAAGRRTRSRRPSARRARPSAGPARPSDEPDLVGVPRLGSADV